VRPSEQISCSSPAAIAELDLILSSASSSARKFFVLHRLGTDEIKACTFTYLLSLAWKDGIFKDLASLDMFLNARPLSEMESLDLTIEEG
jgi:hypothetical protein